jgi:hypothetical protein
MKTPWRLRKTTQRGNVAALLLFTAEVGDVLAVCAAVSPPRGGAHDGAALPPVYPVSNGFLIIGGLHQQPGGAIRLRRLANNLFLPVDADLVPPLLPDEAVALVRDRGLVFLPGGRVLGFDPAEALTAADLLTCPRTPPRGWQALPDRPNLSPGLREVLLDLPDDSPEDLLQAGAGDVGSETPRPPRGMPGAEAIGGAAMCAGHGLIWLGQKLGVYGLARLGAHMIRRAVDSVPRLSESLLGRQEAALRELLRKFREGNLEEALRNALPLDHFGSRGDSAAMDARLPTRNPIYNLRNLLDSGRGAGALWMGRSEVQAELLREYRKAAEAATASGDCRRAAFIYGILLHDYRAAAAVLERGGLHHDAAIVYLKKVSDTHAAARAFEAAGELDRALQLYRGRGDHVAAGDLLRRAGEAELALEEYRLAAAHLAAADNHAAAGDLLRDRGRRPDLALEFFTAGWARRPAASAHGCLIRLVEIRAAEESPANLQALAAEADAFFAPPGNDVAAAGFYNTLARLAEKEHLRAIKNDLRDKALVGLAHKLRQVAAEESRPGNTVSSLLGQSGVWYPAVVSDGAFAFKKALRADPQPRLADTNRARLCSGRVTAACAAPATGRVFVGFDHGLVVMFDPLGEGTWANQPGQSSTATVLSLATDSAGTRVVVLDSHGPNLRTVTSYSAAGGRLQEQAHDILHGPGPAWLTPIAEAEGQAVVGLWTGSVLCMLSADDLVSGGAVIEGAGRRELQAALLFAPDASRRATVAYLFTDAEVYGFSPGVYLRHLKDLYWRLGARDSHSPTVSLSWGLYGSRLELAGIDVEARACWNSLPFGDSHESEVYVSARTPKTGYTAVALLGAGRLAAVRPGHIDWLGRDLGLLLPWASTSTYVADPFACFHSPLTAELLTATGSGWLVRVPVPH